jgi:murein DD-endopeptidase MepM/ murein hydrolase activator NlpD
MAPLPLTPAEAAGVNNDLRSRDDGRIRSAQSRLGVAADGKPGRLTYTALASLWPASFPLTFIPADSYKAGMRAFGARRSGGARAHAGCDLYADPATPIYAVAEGVLLRDPYPYYAGTWAVHVDHGGFEAVYGEIKPGSCTLKKGQTVGREQFLARVGHLLGITVPSDMLHFELYMGTLDGSVSRSKADSARHTNGVPFLRRKDLLNPTPILDVWRKTLPR